TDDEAAGIICPHFHDPTVFERFVMYCSDQAHSSVEKGAMLSAIRLRKLKSTRGFLGNYSVTAQTLRDAIKEDRERGYVPFMFLATVGTTCSCGVDQVDELGPICAAEGLYIHVDAAYAGTFCSV
uniref:Aromatic-L-amino-acid decarboxylase n=1 Tax=Caenorhabditis japonica TaxID=281687 RepID=A0A8R1IED2_CAEJA